MGEVWSAPNLRYRLPETPRKYPELSRIPQNLAEFWQKTIFGLCRTIHRVTRTMQTSVGHINHNYGVGEVLRASNLRYRIPETPRNTPRIGRIEQNSGRIEQKTPEFEPRTIHPGAATALRGAGQHINRYSARSLQCLPEPSHRISYAARILAEFPEFCRIARILQNSAL